MTYIVPGSTSEIYLLSTNVILTKVYHLKMVVARYFQAKALREDASGLACGEQHTQGIVRRAHDLCSALHYALLAEAAGGVPGRRV